jgi:predicted RNA-binding Zn-ribbon protein involved in translation (DUF1610 family)
MPNDSVQITSGTRIELIRGPRPIVNPCPLCGGESEPDPDVEGGYICTKCGYHFTK